MDSKIRDGFGRRFLFILLARIVCPDAIFVFNRESDKKRRNIMPRTGVLPKQMLRELCVAGHIKGVGEQYLNPASVDLPLADEAYRLESIFLPLRGEKVRDLLPLVGATPHNFSNPLEVGVPYLIRVAGEWRLPSTVYGYANPKSSTGRNGFFCRPVADAVDMYEALTGPGWSGETWVLARPDYFPVLLSPE